MGVTGFREDLDAKARALVPRIRGGGARSGVYVGIGVSTARQVAEVWEYADGAIVGTAIVRALADGGISGLSRFARELSAS